MLDTPGLVGDILSANGLSTLGGGEIVIPESLLNRLLSGLDLPMPLESIDVACQAGYVLISVNLNLRGHGLPIRPKVQQMFQLERLRIDPVNQFILLSLRGGLRIREESLGRSRLSPVASAIISSMLHTPTLLKLLRDRFPKSVNYVHGKLHINLAGSGLLEGHEVALGHVNLNVLEYLTIRNVAIKRGAVVIHFRFDKEAMLAELHSEPPEGFYDPPERPETELNPARLLPEQAGASDDRSRPKRALDAGVRASKMSVSATKAGARILGRLIRRRK